LHLRICFAQYDVMNDDAMLAASWLKLAAELQFLNISALQRKTLTETQGDRVVQWCNDGLANFAINSLQLQLGGYS